MKATRNAMRERFFPRPSVTCDLGVVMDVSIQRGMQEDCFGLRFAIRLG
jgi:hypothetical protein